MNDELGTRMKEQYENRTRYFLPRRTYTLLRLDGKAFHTYTHNLEKPFDDALSEDLDNAIIAMMPELQGAVFAYTQSDEISVLLTDFAKPTTSAWFDNNLQKMVSVSAATMTAEFNRLRMIGWMKGQRYAMRGKDGQLSPARVLGAEDLPLAKFDSRAFTIPDRTEVMNYFIWRNQDCARNSVSMVAQSKFSHKELQGKNTPAMHEMMHKIGVNWATDYTDAQKNGRLIVKEEYLAPASVATTSTFRTRWVSKPAWKFTENKDKLLAMIPQYEQ